MLWTMKPDWQNERHLVEQEQKHFRLLMTAKTQKTHLSWQQSKAFNGGIGLPGKTCNQKVQDSAVTYHQKYWWICQSGSTVIYLLNQTRDRGGGRPMVSSLSSTSTIRVVIPLKSSVFSVKCCLKRTNNSKKSSLETKQGGCWFVSIYLIVRSFNPRRS